MKDLLAFDMDFEDKKEKEESGEYEPCDICQQSFHIDDLVIPDKEFPKAKICTGCLKGAS